MTAPEPTGGYARLLDGHQARQREAEILTQMTEAVRAAEATPGSGKLLVLVSKSGYHRIAIELIIQHGPGECSDAIARVPGWTLKTVGTRQLLMAGAAQVVVAAGMCPDEWMIVRATGIDGKLPAREGVQ